MKLLECHRRQQLGDRLPGSFQTAARSMGVTERELTRLVESGQLGSVEFLRNFIPALNETAVASGALEASLRTSRVAMSRFRTAFQLNILESFEAGAESGLSAFFNDLSATLSDLGPVFRFLGRTVGIFVEGVGLAIRSLSVLLAPVRDGILAAFGFPAQDAIGSTTSLLEGVGSVIREITGDLLIFVGIIERVLALSSSLDRGRQVAARQFATQAQLDQLASFSAAGTISNIFNGFPDRPVTGTGAAPSNVANINITATDPLAVGEIVNAELQNLFTVNMSTGN